jgi:ketosteroid isomerase-like protein
MVANTPQDCSTQFTVALVGRDLEAALALLSDEAVLFFSNGSVIAGKEAFAATMRVAWQVVEDYRYETLDQRWIAQNDDGAAVIYHFAWSGVARGASVSGGGRGTRVFVRTAAGWVIAHEHLSAGNWF